MDLKDKKQIIIGVAGGSGSGKTSFISNLKEKFPQEQVCFVSQDNYYKPREQQLRDKEGIKNFDLPYSINLDNLYYDILKLIQGKELKFLEYTFNNDFKDAREICIRPAPVIVVEGLYVFYYQLLRELFDLKVFVHAHDTYKIIRRIKRDIEERNYPMDDVIYRYQNHVQPSYDKHIAPYIWESDVIINNNNNYPPGLRVIEGFIKDFLRNKNKT